MSIHKMMSFLLIINFTNLPNNQRRENRAQCRYVDINLRLNIVFSVTKNTSQFCQIAIYEKPE